ncbi:MAG: hypothetical protein M3Z08_09585 [Chloroflexota bacterium]|nr:hypothetical protein [Chloroflexota bacterium]
MPPIRLVEIHPILVHFPIALLIVAVLLDFLALFLRRAHLVEAATWCLGFGALGLLAAELSGNLIEDHVNRALAGNLLELHKTFALTTVFTFCTLFVLRIVWLSPHILSALRPSIPATASLERSLLAVLPILGKTSPLLISLYLLASLAGLVFLSITGFLGGSMVYDHGVGMPSGSIPFMVGRLLLCVRI